MPKKPAPDSAKLFATIGIGVVLIGLLATMYFWLTQQSGDDRFAQCRTTKVAGGSATIGGPFQLTDENGNKVTEADVITGPTLVYFGYSYCPDVCPLDGIRNAEVATILRDQNKPVGDLFITIDPERDTPEVMAEFTEYFDEEMIGLTGTQEEITAAAKAYRVYFSKSGEGEDYLMDHSTLTYLMSPQDGLLEIFRRDMPADKMAEQVGCFVENI